MMLLKNSLQMIAPIFVLKILQLTNFSESSIRSLKFLNVPKESKYQE